MAGQVGFVFGGFMAYSFHIKELVARYGKEIVLLGFMPYIFVGIAVVIILLVLGKKWPINSFTCILANCFIDGVWNECCIICCHCLHNQKD